MLRFKERVGTRLSYKVSTTARTIDVTEIIVPFIDDDENRVEWYRLEIELK
jgi:hypothetical protein